MTTRSRVVLLRSHVEPGRRRIRIARSQRSRRQCRSSALVAHHGRVAPAASDPSCLQPRDTLDVQGLKPEHSVLATRTQSDPLRQLAVRYSAETQCSVSLSKDKHRAPSRGMRISRRGAGEETLVRLHQVFYNQRRRHSSFDTRRCRASARSRSVVIQQRTRRSDTERIGTAIPSLLTLASTLARRLFVSCHAVARSIAAGPKERSLESLPVRP